MLLLAWLLCAGSALGLDRNKVMRQFAHQSWGAADGIDKVYAITQTKDGYLWIGTGAGLYQFDGTRFVRWQPVPGEPGLQGPVSALLGSSDGSLWASANAVVIQIKDGHSRRFRAEDGGESHPIQIREMSDGTIWFAGRELARFTNGKLESVRVHQAAAGSQYRGPVEDGYGTLWFSLLNTSSHDPSSDGQLAFLRAGQKEFQVCRESFPATYDLCLAPDGKLWTAQTRRSVRAFVPEGAECRFVAPEIRVGSQSILFDRDGALWITTVGDGLRRIKDPSALGPNDIAKHGPEADAFGQKDGLSSDMILCAMEDREGNIWLGTSNGLDCFRENKISALSVREGLPFDQNLVLARSSDGSIWAGATPRGLMELPKGGTAFIERGWLGMTPEGEAATRPRSARLFCIYPTTDGRLLAATAHGVAVVRPDGSSEILKLPGGVQFLSTLTITNDRDGGLWLCDTAKGVHRFAGEKLEQFPQIPRDVVASYGDSDGRVWLGFRKGGVAFFESGQFHFFTAKDGLLPGEIRAIASDASSNILFIGQGGISRFSQGRIQTLTRQNGLPEDDLVTFLTDDDGNYWFAGMAAIFRVTPANLDHAFASPSDKIAFENFDLSDGLRGFVRQAAFGYPGVGYPLSAKGPDGRLWFSSSGGLGVIDPHNIPRNTVPPPVHIQEVLADGKTYRNLDRLDLPIGTKQFEVDYIGLSFANPAKVRYRYKLEGYEEDWVDAGTRHQAVYSNLRPKNYSFRVMASNNDGVWNETGATLSFAILPAYYQTKWFLMLCILAGIAALWGFHRLRLARLAARMKLELATQQKERKRIAQELHDTLLQGFTGIGLKLDAIASGLPDSLADTRNQLQHLLDQSDHYLADARRTVWELRSTSLEVCDNFETALSKAGKRMLHGTGISFSFSVSGSSRKLAPFVESNLQRICDEAMSNAVKHAQATTIEVKLDFQPCEVRMEIRDNGIGFNSDGPDRVKAGHFGLVGMQERVKTLSGDLKLKSQPRGGTEVIVTVPA